MSSQPTRDIYNETLAIFDRRGDRAEPLTTPEIAAALDANRRTVYKRLQKLVDRGELDTKAVGANARVWWRPSHFDRTRREEELERYEAIIEAMGDPVYCLDTEGRFTFVNQSLADRSGYDTSELLGRHVTIGMDDDDVARTAEVIAELITDDHRDSATVEYEVITKDGERLLAENHISLLTDGKGNFRGTAGVLRDITERKERERALMASEQRYKTLVDNFPNGAVTLVNEALEYVTVGGTPIEDADATVEDLEGSPMTDVLPKPFIDLLLPHYIDALDGQSSTFEHEFGGRHYWFTVLPVRDDHGEVFGALGMSQDITDRKAYEQDLHTQVRQLEVISELGHNAVENRDIDDLMERAVELVAETLDNEYCKILDLEGTGEELLLRHGTGWADGIVGTTTVSATDNASQAAYTLSSNQPVVVEDLACESRFSGPVLLTSHDVRSGISTIIGSADEPWGILGTHATATKAFKDNDVNFVQSVANILASAITRHHDEMELASQREHLAALDDLNTVVREITHLVIEQSTRESIEQLTCDQLAASASYKGARIVDVDQRTGEITTRATAGDATIEDRLPPDDSRRIRDVVHSRDPRFSQATNGSANGVRWTASIPILHDDTRYGVLHVIAERPDAVTADEEAVIGQLGEIIGHAIAAVERKRALLSDEVIELEFHIQDVFEELGVPIKCDGTITLDQTVPVGDGVYLEFGTATGDAIDAVEVLVDSDAVPHWESLQVHKRTDGMVRFEVTMTEPPAVASIAANGGYIDEATIEDGDFYMRVHLTPTANVRRVVDAINTAYPSVQVGSQRQVTRDPQSTARLRGVLFEELTERQRAALEAGYYAGFFNWPRESSGEAVAESLGIGSSTFHQHRRKAEKRLLDLVFAER